MREYGQLSTICWKFISSLGATDAPILNPGSTGFFICFYLFLFALQLSL